jgi:hypothetical protein
VGVLDPVEVKASGGQLVEVDAEIFAERRSKANPC